MTFDHEKVKDIASAFQSIVIALSFIVVGVWTIFTFDALQARDRARAELTRLEQDIQQQRARAVLPVTLEANQQTLPGDQGRYIQVTAHIENLGNRSVRVGLGNEVVAAAKVVHNEQGHLETEKTYHAGVVAFSDAEQTSIWNVPFAVLDPHDSGTLPFWVRVGDPGLYLVEFQAMVTGPDEEESQEVSDVPGQRFAVKARTFVVVQ